MKMNVTASLFVVCELNCLLIFGIFDSATREFSSIVNLKRTIPIKAFRLQPNLFSKQCLHTSFSNLKWNFFNDFYRFALFISVSSSQSIAHSSLVQTPKRHNSESVLYLNEDSSNIIGSDVTTHNSMKTTDLRYSRSNHRLFPVSTYIEPMHAKNQIDNRGPLKWVFRIEYFLLDWNFEILFSFSFSQIVTWS